MTPEAMTEFLRSRIPLVRAMELRVLNCDDRQVRIAAPLAPNLNHRNTAFGGSLATLGIVSGWALLHFALLKAGLEARLVIQKSECDFIEPLAEEFVSESRMPEAEWRHFADTLKRRGRARITVESEIGARGGLAVKCRGTYVALL